MNRVVTAYRITCAVIDRAASATAIALVFFLLGCCVRPFLEDYGHIKPRCVLDKGLYDLATGENITP